MRETTRPPRACSADQAALHRLAILRAMHAKYPVSAAQIWQPTVEALEMLRDLYDHLFFEDALAHTGKPIRMLLSGRMTRAAGNFRYMRDNAEWQWEIRLSSDIWPRLAEGPWHVNGVEVQTRLEAVMLVVEHELCHALELACHGTCRGHGVTFQGFARGFFGHTAWTHQLPTRANALAENGFLPGAWVGFSHQGKVLKGQIARVYKRVAVMVPDKRGAWCDAKGRRMARYLVPPEKLFALDK